MIYTVTLNPAIDYVINLEELKIGEILSSKREGIYFGGKGINVSLVLKELGVKSVALGFVAGFTGEAINKFLNKSKIKTDFITLKEGNSRINVKLRSGIETDINCDGPKIAESDIKELLKRLKRIKKGDTVVLTGSVPSWVRGGIYADIMEMLTCKGVRFLVDARGEALLNTLKHKPFLIKPNVEELSEVFSVKINKDNALEYAERLQKMGALNVLVSLGKEGALLLSQDKKVYFAEAKNGKTVNTVGAGDSMVAGFLAGLIKTNNLEYALKLGTACGGATAFSEGLAAKEKIEELL